MKWFLGNLRLVATVSVAVIAACLLVLTVRVLFFGVPVAHQKVYDQADLTARVSKALDRVNISTIGMFSCPANVTMESGVTFECTVDSDGRTGIIEAEVVDTDSGAVEFVEVTWRK